MNQPFRDAELPHPGGCRTLAATFPWCAVSNEASESERTGKRRI